MSAEKRSVSTDALETLGTIIDNNAGRDAIHLAVEPTIAGELLRAGQHVGILKDKATTKARKKLGIVDPFLKDVVQPGEMFWLIVYPRQITSLRHVWSHPDFPEKEVGVNDPALYEMMEEKLKSEEWIKNYAVYKGLEYEELMDGAESYMSHGEYLCKGSLLDGEHTDSEFWDHYEIVTGKNIRQDQRGNFFTCSC